MYMLDTNICIYIRQLHRRRDDMADEAANLSRHFSQRERGEVCMSVITYSELAYGVYKGGHARNLRDLHKITELISIEPLPPEAGIEYGKIRSELESRGELIGPNDLLIAAHALTLGRILVTNNEREFKRVKDLQTENWARR